LETIERMNSGKVTESERILAGFYEKRIKDVIRIQLFGYPNPPKEGKEAGTLSLEGWGLQSEEEAESARSEDPSSTGSDDD
jgi:hypothetical protein